MVDIRETKDGAIPRIMFDHALIAADDGIRLARWSHSC